MVWSVHRNQLFKALCNSSRENEAIGLSFKVQFNLPGEFPNWNFRFNSRRNGTVDNRWKFSEKMPKIAIIFHRTGVCPKSQSKVHREKSIAHIFNLNPFSVRIFPLFISLLSLMSKIFHLRPLQFPSPRSNLWNYYNR